MFPKAHFARVADSKGIKARQASTIAPGITGVIGTRVDGTSQLEAVIFDSGAFTPEKAQKWLEDSGHDSTCFQKADAAAHAVRWDKATIRRKPIRTPEGFLKADASVTRTGVLLYINGDGSIRRELRHPDDVFVAKSLDSMKMIPVTNGHPIERLVTPETARYYQVGATGENIRRDGDFVVCPIVITDGDTIADVDRGRNEVSLGYEVDLVPEQGEYNGEQYDFRQTNIRYNHLAVVDAARAGKEAMIHLDSADAVQNLPTNQSMEENMPKFNIDGIGYDAAQEVINHIVKLDSRVSEAEKGLADANSRADTFAGERDAAKAELEKLQKVDHSEAVRTAVRQRRELERKAEAVLPDNAEIKVDELSDRALMEAAIKSIHADADFTGKSDEYVLARFDAVTETAKGSKQAAGENRAAAMGDAFVKTDGNTVEDARKRMINRTLKREEKK